MLFSYKIFTFSQPFSQLPNKFYVRKSTTTHRKSITIHTKPTTTQHKNHQITTTHTTTTTTKKSEIKERKQINEWQMTRSRGDNLTEKAATTRSKGDDLTQRRMRWSRGRRRQSDPVQKSKARSRLDDLGGEDLTQRRTARSRQDDLSGAILQARSHQHDLDNVISKARSCQHI